jgi:hypothetical protein
MAQGLSEKDGDVADQLRVAVAGNHERRHHPVNQMNIFQYLAELVVQLCAQKSRAK